MPKDDGKVAIFLGMKSVVGNFDPGYRRDEWPAAGVGVWSGVEVNILNQLPLTIFSILTSK